MRSMARLAVFRVLRHTPALRWRLCGPGQLAAMLDQQRVAQQSHSVKVAQHAFFDASIVFATRRTSPTLLSTKAHRMRTPRFSEPCR